MLRGDLWAPPSRSWALPHILCNLSGAETRLSLMAMTSPGFWTLFLLSSPTLGIDLKANDHVTISMAVSIQVKGHQQFNYNQPVNPRTYLTHRGARTSGSVSRQRILQHQKCLCWLPGHREAHKRAGQGKDQGHLLRTISPSLTLEAN